MRTGLTMIAQHNFLLAIVCVLLGLPSSRTRACDYLTMRDAGFDEPRDVHLLCVFGNKVDPDARAVHDRLDRWLKTEGKDLNVALEYVAVDNPEVKWAEYGVPSAPPSTPVVALIGTAVGRENWVIHHWQPAPTDADLDQLIDSGVRHVIRRAVGKRLAVIVHVPAAEPSESKVTKFIIARTLVNWADHMDQDLGLMVFTVDRSDERERFLLRFMGIEPDGEDWLALVFGRGKFMSPLKGEEITQANLDDQLEALMAECTCLRSPRTLGVDVPMAWEQELNQQIVRLKTEEDPVLSPATPPAVDPPPTPLIWTVTVYTLTAIPVLVAIIAGGLCAIRHRRSRRNAN